ncbi:SulP family inorganic anion transporter [Methylocapsa sp. S129]|uniref:SulP family inorganic anion transporter n=1 Tax=Methylocapsa sp. S129 TaxID=1641869 RepID=UPI00131C7FF0|nr:SulP family inorganic anion transporter [Methylocapsa sp. S129]
MNETHSPVAARPWPVLRSFAGWRFADLGPDVIAGLTLAAIAIPEQMATARLGGFAPQIGFLAIIAGAVGFAIFGSNRAMSVGADSTITPIFAGGLALIAASGSPHYAALAAMLALMVGAMLIVGGLLRLGWIADLLSIPVTTGFLAGIAGHIILSQAPALLGVAGPEGSFIDKITALAGALGSANILTLAIGLGVLAIMLIGERISPRVPGALIGLGGATALVAALGLENHGVAALGAVAGAIPTLKMPEVSLDDLTKVVPLAFIVAVVVMVQTAATTRSFPAGREPDVNRDFVGVGAASVLAGLTGAFPVNASPPRTAVVVETGGASQLGALVCAALVLALSAFGADLLTHVPYAALAGVLLFVAQRIIRVSTFVDVWRQSLAEFALIVATMAAILFLPIQQGVGIGIILSLLHGVWTTTRAKTVEFARIPGSTIWWPKTNAAQPGETIPGVLVVALQAPLSFLNAYDFQHAIQRFVAARAPVRLVVIEADSIVEIDYTAAQVLSAGIRQLHEQGIAIAVARLESVRAQEAFARLGLEKLIGADHLFHSVEEAVQALKPQSAA